MKQMKTDYATAASRGGKWTGVLMSAILAGSLAGTGVAFAGSPAADRAQTINPEEVGKREDGQSKFVEATPLQHAKMRTLMRGSKFIGTQVYEGTNTEFGKVKDAAIDLHTGRIEYVVVSTDKLGKKNQLVAMPPEVFRAFRNTEFFSNEVKVEVPMAQLKQLPTLTDDKSLGAMNSQARDAMYQALNVKAPTARDQATRLSKASDIIGADVVLTRQGDKEKGADIKDLALDLNDGYAPYAIVSVGGVAGIGDKLVAVPTGAFMQAGEKDKLQASLSEAQLKSAPAIDKKNWDQALADREVGKSLYSAYGLTPYWDTGVGAQPSATGGTTMPDTETLERRGK